MKSKIFLIAVFLPLMLTGCALSTGIESLLVPPKLGTQHQDIYNALKNYTGENVDLKYPKSGKNLSAFIIEDIDGDAEDEAIVFYKKKTGASANDSLRINILDTSDSKWKSVYDHAADGNELEQIEVTKLGDSDRINIIVGYSLINRSDKKITVYDYQNGKLNANLSNEPYSVFKTIDLNNDNTNELFIASQNSLSDKASAVLYHLYENDRYKRSEVTLGETYNGYSNISVCTDSEENTRIFLDAMTGNGNVATEVFKADEQNNLLSEFSPDIQKHQTIRPSVYKSADVDNDGMVEIPVPYFYDGYDENSEHLPCITSWYEVEGDKLKHKYETYMSITDEYVFFIPSQWYGNVTLKSDVSKNEISVCSGSNPETADVIFTLKVVRDKEKTTINEENGWTLLRTRGERHFFLKINQDNPMAVSFEEIAVKFKFND